MEEHGFSLARRGFEMFLRKIIPVIGVVALSLGVIAEPQASASIENSEVETSLEGDSVAPIRYVKADSPEQARQILNHGGVGVQPYAVNVKYGPCTLKPSQVHVRTRTGDGDARIIGFKPETFCERKVESIKHESTLKYKYYAWWRDAPLAHGVPTRIGNVGEARLTQRNIEFHCNGLVDSTFIGHTVGTIVDGGETYYASVDTDVFKEACKV